PLVTGEAHVRFYAGAPLVTTDGHALGMLCVLDRKERPTGIGKDEANILLDLSKRVMHEFEGRYPPSIKSLKFANIQLDAI
ncbi:MAG: GAF domain-containing protein, partial [Cytophagaceae bacterium]